MINRISRRALISRADINTDLPDGVYFPFPESARKIAYSCNVYGCTGMLYEGYESGALYALDPYGSDTPGADMRKAMGAREKAVISKLDHTEIIEQRPHGFMVLAFVARDGSRFTVVTRDKGHTWTICN